MSFYSGKKVLVTGGCGFIGSHLAEALCSLGAEVTIIDNLERGQISNIQNIRKQVTVLIDDLRSRRSCDVAVKRQDLIFHLAFKVGGASYTGASKYFSEIWRDGTVINMNVIESCLRYNIQKLLYVSSACVYPEQLQLERGIPLKEADAFPANPKDAYGWSKLMGELQCRWYYQNYDLDSAVIRPFNVYGERDYFTRDSDHVLPVLCRKVLSGNSFVVHGDGNNTRSFVYVWDVVVALLCAMECISKAEVVNVGGGSVSVKEIVEKLIKLGNKSYCPIYDENYPVTGVKHSTADLSRANQLLHWTPRTSFDDGVSKTFAWVKHTLEKQRNEVKLQP